MYRMGLFYILLHALSPHTDAALKHLGHTLIFSVKPSSLKGFDIDRRFI
jgi:hypothetical protein